MSQDDPLSPSSTKNNQVDSENNNQGEPNMIKEKFIKNQKPITYHILWLLHHILTYNLPTTYNLTLNGAWQFSTVGLVFFIF